MDTHELARFDQIIEIFGIAHHILRAVPIIEKPLSNFQGQLFFTFERISSISIL
jgi:hypothetical protein